MDGLCMCSRVQRTNSTKLHAGILQFGSSVPFYRFIHAVTLTKVAWTLGLRSWGRWFDCRSVPHKLVTGLVAWLSGNPFHSVNEVTLSQAKSQRNSDIPAQCHYS